MKSPNFELLAALSASSRGLIVPSAVALAGLGSRLEAVGPDFAEEAARHKVAGSVLSAIRKLGLRSGPEVMAALDRRVKALVATRSLLLAAWPLVAGAFEARGVACITLKGPATSIRLYADASAREYGDLDLLVECDDNALIASIMAEAGFEPGEGEAEARLLERHPRLAAEPHHLVFRHGTWPIHAELHASLDGNSHASFRASRRELLRRAATASFEGRSYPVLGKTDEALFMIDHGSRHAWCALHWLLDAASLLSSRDSGLHVAIAEGAGEYGMGAQVAVACLLVEAVFSIAAPPELAPLVRARAASVNGAVAFCRSCLESGMDSPSPLRSVVGKMIRLDLPLSARPRHFAGRLFALFRVTAADVGMLRIPDALFVLYLPLRPILVAYRRMARLLSARKLARR